MRSARWGRWRPAARPMRPVAGTSVTGRRAFRVVCFDPTNRQRRRTQLNRTDDDSPPQRRLTLALDVDLIADLEADRDLLLGIRGDGKSSQLTSAQPTNSCASLSTGI